MPRNAASMGGRADQRAWPRYAAVLVRGLLRCTTRIGRHRAVIPAD
jgi:hypothetical protein